MRPHHVILSQEENTLLWEFHFTTQKPDLLPRNTITHMTPVTGRLEKNITLLQMGNKILITSHHDKMYKQNI